MDFRPSEEQQMLVDTVNRLIDKDYDFETRQTTAGSEPGISEAHWQSFAELGLLAVNVPEAFDGLGASSLETALIMEAFGRGLVVEPYVSTAVIGSSLINDSDNTTLQTLLLPAIATGSVKLAMGVLEPEQRFNRFPVSTTVICEGQDHILNGVKSVVLDAPFADYFLVPARTDANGTDQHDMLVACVPRDAPGLSLHSFPNIDGSRCGELTLNNVVIESSMIVASGSQAWTALDRALDKGVAALCNEAVGVMGHILGMTLEHLKTRQQFGQPLAKFQVLQHRSVELLALVERSRSMALLAAARADSDNPVERQQAVSAAKAYIGGAAKKIGRQGIHMHGGIGMTNEFAIGHYVKRLLCIEKSYGDEAYHLARFRDSA